MKRKEDNVIPQEPAKKKTKKSITFAANSEKKSAITPQINKNDNTKKLKKNGKTPSQIEKFNKSKQSGFSKSLTIQNSTGDKPDWREFKKEKKELKEKRKSKKLSTVYDVYVKAKQLSEKLRRADCSAEDRDKLTVQLYKLFEGNFNKLVLTHDMSRVIQWIIKYANPQIRQSIINEIKPSLLSMFQSTYGQNCIKKALKHGSPEIREEILSACNGSVVKLVSHSIASPILNQAYNKYATDKTKIYFKQEFFGDMYKRAKDEQIKTLTDVFEKAKDMKSATLSAVKINLLRVLNKKLVNSALVHSVLVEFLAVCSAEDRSELIVMLRDSIIELSWTKEGANVAMQCIWHGTTKDRKSSLKAMKDHVKEIAVSEHGHLILLAMFDSIDDTVLMKKILIPEVLSNIQEIVASEYGKKIILYLVARRDTKHFHPAVIAQLQQGDTNIVSKKPAENRASELVEAVADSLLEAIVNDPNTWLASSSIAMVTLAILKASCGKKNLNEAFTAIAAFLTNSESIIKDEKIELKAIEHPGLHMMLKQLIIADKVLIEKNQSTFGDALIEQLDEMIIKQWCDCNRACFLLVLLLENESETAINSLMPKLKAVTETLKKKKFKGASILLKKIK